MKCAPIPRATTGQCLFEIPSDYDKIAGRIITKNDSDQRGTALTAIGPMSLVGNAGSPGLLTDEPTFRKP